MYGSYLKRDVDVVDAAKNVAIFDTIAGLVSACVVVPAVFAFGLDVSSGPPLLFITLAQVFQEMPFGGVFAVILFVAVVFAAITSLMNLFEAPVEALQKQLGLSRLASVGIIAVAAVAVGLFIEGGSSVSDWMDVISIYVIPAGRVPGGHHVLLGVPGGLREEPGGAGAQEAFGSVVQRVHPLRVRGHHRAGHRARHLLRRHRVEDATLVRLRCGWREE